MFMVGVLVGWLVVGVACLVGAPRWMVSVYRAVGVAGGRVLPEASGYCCPECSPPSPYTQVVDPMVDDRVWVNPCLDSEGRLARNPFSVEPDERDFFCAACDEQLVWGRGGWETSGDGWVACDESTDEWGRHVAKVRP